MSRHVQNRSYQPDLAIPPGETILEALGARGMNQEDLCKRLAEYPANVSGLIKGKMSISPNMALRLERVLGIPASFWLNLQAQFDETRARVVRTAQLEEEKGLLGRFPYAEMASRGWVSRTRIAAEKVENLLAFFALNSLSQVKSLYEDAYQPSFRKSRGKSFSPDSVAAWLRKAEIEAARIQTRPFQKSRLKALIPRLRRLTAEPFSSVREELQEACASCGVAVVFIPHLKKTYVQGATMWIRSENTRSKDKAVVALSFRYRTTDVLWFSLLHELGHLILNRRKVFLEFAEGPESDEEKKADRYAADALIPPDRWASFRRCGPFSREAILSFSKSIGIDPGIVVGRLQHEEVLPPTHLNDLRPKVDSGS